MKKHTFTGKKLNRNEMKTVLGGQAKIICPRVICGSLLAGLECVLQGCRCATDNSCIPNS
ncbi:bacteriocin-like protein [Chitinophaga nivalis]|uniref:Bacteriocin n=1 Tax=Chitinophaga nivalis TaxID=2991709 RepID=A0ABT3IUX5_9BACT|nr:hypothetical protein [Chitinophaga nivalis]MCW3462512.1 hypothetical protein [Chitinophaga nivalis]MCW3487797.1 hypothetical protein [Chitinophaga nivalis]